MRPQKVVFIYDLVVIESYDSATASLRWILDSNQTLF